MDDSPSTLGNLVALCVYESESSPKMHSLDWLAAVSSVAWNLPICAQTRFD